MKQHRKEIFLDWWDSYLLGNIDIKHQSPLPTEIVIGLWGSKTLPSILLPSYLLGWLEELNKGDNQNLRIFFAAHLASCLNWGDKQKYIETAEITKKFLYSFLKEFHNKDLPKINIDIDTDDEAREAIEFSKKTLDSNFIDKIDTSVLESMKAKYNKHSDNNNNWSHFLMYPLCHPVYERLLNSNKHIIKIWWRTEQLFNWISQILLEELNQQNRTVLQKTTKSWKSPLYYLMNWEPHIWQRIENISNIVQIAWMRDFDVSIIQDRIGEARYIERYNDNLLSK